jgi:hypothetical protein
MEPAKTLADMRGLLAPAGHGCRSTRHSDLGMRPWHDQASCRVGVCGGWYYLAIQLVGPSFVLPTH